MITLDKLVFAFKLELESEKGIEKPFAVITDKIASIDLINEDNDFFDFIDSEYVPNETYEPQQYKWNETELRDVDLSEIKTYFKYNYWIYYKDVKLGILQWGSYGTTSKYAYATITNECFYNGTWVLYKYAFRDLSLTINNITRLDIAYDSTINPTKRYMQIVKDEANSIVINGKKVNNRDKLLHSPYFICHGSLNKPLQHPQIHFTTLDKSILCRCYNKTSEIQVSNKNYIKEFHSRCLKVTKSDIYRCEVSLNSKSIKRIVETLEDGLCEFVKLVETDVYLLQLHKETMLRMFRYSSNGKEKRKTLLSYYH